MFEENEIKELNGVYYFDPNGESYFNMAFDNWLFEKIQNDPSFPRVILRLYSWDKPSITLGHNQNINKAIDFGKVDKTVPVIRRISGGRAIYHDKTEITFGLTADLRIFPEKQRSLSATNQLISETVVQTLESVGVVSELTKKSDSSFSLSANMDKKSCFNSYSRYEIFSPKGKIVAGAQRRKGDYFIHQGSIKINGISDCPAIGQINETESTSKSRDGVNSYDYTIDQFRIIFKDEFAKSLKVNLSERTLEREFHREIQLLAEKYCKNTEIFI